MSWRRALRILIGLVALASVVGAFAPGVAHAVDQVDQKLSSPKPFATVEEPPKSITMVFNRKLDGPPTVTLRVGTPGKLTTVAISEPQPGKDAREWIVTPLKTLANGEYQVTVAGTATVAYSFKVGPPPPVTLPGGGTLPSAVSTPATAPSGSSGVAASSSAGPSTAMASRVGTFGRWLSYLGVGALCGALVLIALAWQEGVEYTQTVRFLKMCWLIGLVGTVLTLMSLTASAKGTGIGSGLSPGGWIDIAGDNRAALGALLRLFFVLASVWVAWAPERVVDAATSIIALSLPILAMATFGLSRVEGSRFVALGMLAGAVHAVAFGAWFGGLMLLWRVTLIGPGEADQVQAVRGFSRIAVPALMAVFVTGFLQVFRLLGGPSKLLGTGWGRWVLLKTVLAVGMAYVGTANRKLVLERLGRRSQLSDRAAFRLGRKIGAEATWGIGVMVVSGLLMGTLPATVQASAGPAVNGPVIRSNLQFANEIFEGSVAFSSTAAGPIDTIIVVRKPLSQVRELLVQISPIDGFASSFKINLTDADLARNGTVVIPNMRFDTGGQWLVLVSGATQASRIAPMQAVLELTGDVVPAPGSTPATTAAPA